MEVDMIATVKWLMPVVAIAFPLTVFAQTDDAAYCKALANKYEAFVSNLKGHSIQPGGLDGNVAIAQCREGNTAAGIPVLERKLKDAKIDLPKRS
jgi:hypothetical protein